MSSYYTKKTKTRPNEGTKFQDIGLKVIFFYINMQCKHFGCTQNTYVDSSK